MVQLSAYRKVVLLNTGNELYWQEGTPSHSFRVVPGSEQPNTSLSYVCGYHWPGKSLAIVGFKRLDTFIIFDFQMVLQTAAPEVFSSPNNSHVEKNTLPYDSKDCCGYQPQNCCYSRSGRILTFRILWRAQDWGVVVFWHHNLIVVVGLFCDSECSFWFWIGLQSHQ